MKKYAKITSVNKHFDVKRKSIAAIIVNIDVKFQKSERFSLSNLSCHTRLELSLTLRNVISQDKGHVKRCGGSVFGIEARLCHNKLLLK